MLKIHPLMPAELWDPLAPSNRYPNRSHDNTFRNQRKMMGSNGACMRKEKMNIFHYFYLQCIKRDEL